MKKIHLFTALFLLLSIPLLMESARAASPQNVGSVGVRIAQIPADVANHPYAKAYIVSRVYPGVLFTQRLEVFNTSSQAFLVHLYPGKATFSNGNFEVADGRAGNDLTSWIKVDPDSVNVKPGESKYFDVNILPPVGAPSVQLFGVIWAEVQGAKDAAGITAVSRVGIRMYVPVGDSAAIAIGGSSITSSTNEIIVKKSLISAHILEVISLLVLLLILFFVIFIFMLRRGSSDHQFRKANEKLLESQWKRERNRRRAIWKNGGHLRNPIHFKHRNNEYDEEE